ncbi:centrosomal and chromosomal factor-like isoform X2 [Belonocnema kinseyi]|nr:centrosomal and chromosomal factor-like isoform X2 [Belonocnema kinseyi]XP_033230607.1 centrosomal and chromosomal factor-like isoform X2 [Belonocnema kinseyi]
MILYTFTQFHTTPAIVTSVFIALGILFCGCAMVHNVFVWQREKTNSMKAMAREQCEAAAHLQRQQQHLQQQQQQHHHQQQLRSILPCPPKLENLTTVHSISAHSRGSQCQQPSQHFQHHHHTRHVSMSPPLLLSSPVPSGLAATHNHHNMFSHRGVPATPPASSGDQSPNSPANKHKTQQNLSRDATGSVSPGIPAATLDLSSAATTNSPHELSTLV